MMMKIMLMMKMRIMFGKVEIYEMILLNYHENVPVHIPVVVGGDDFGVGGGVVVVDDDVLNLKKWKMLIKRSDEKVKEVYKKKGK